MESLSPAETDTKVVTLFPVVAVFAIVVVSAVSAPFFRTVNMRDAPEPGAVASLT